MFTKKSNPQGQLETLQGWLVQERLARLQSSQVAVTK